jgi:flagellar biosynthetic protein FlhB
MAAENDGQEKTEAPTERKREKSREEGQVAFSRELPSAALLAAAAVTFAVTGGALLQASEALFADIFRNLVLPEDMTINTLYNLLRTSLATVIVPLIPFGALIIVVGIFSSVLQVGFRLTPKAIAPKFSKLSPAQGLKRIFGTQGLVELLKSMAKLIIIGFIGFMMYRDEMLRINSLAVTSPENVVIYSFETIADITLQMVLALVAIALFDFFYQRWKHEQDLRMTKQEVKDENKQTEGDPQLKSRIRQIQREMSNARMMQEVPKADAVVVNPTHFAVAIKYDRETMAAPEVIAKGIDYMALRIKKVAKEHDVAVLERPQLAREMYAAIEIGQPIPERFFKAVAEILAYVYRLRKKKK